ncbi:SUMO-specific isopeptidase USPL1 isoform X2 [Pleurodeles waltl]|uniref:SUMO-specific isopeptidase USPL1 isoform X2 n=1 Tax=Pleurodeles waltl TaxID=8319 RepID=UPI003709C13B
MGEQENRKQVYESCKVTSDECCPACEIKGLTRSLHAYRISFKESIVLCENPQCIYPLGHKPLQSLTIGADLGNYQSTPNPSKRCPSKHSPRKRKLLGSASQVSLNTSSSIEPCVKHPKVITLVSPESSLSTDGGIGQNDNPPEQKTLAIDIISDDTPKQSSPSEDVEHSLAAGNIEIPYNAPQSSIQNSNSDTEQFSEVLRHIKTSPVTGPAVFVPSFQGKPLHLQWRNRDALCWLDCILSSLVHLKTLKKAVAEGCIEEDSIFKQLLSKYNQANALVTYRCRGEGDPPEVSLEVLDQAEKHLNDIRNKIFDLLQPQLKCELGKNDMPVFALPLLLQKDSCFQKVFEHSFVWKFECLQCGFKSQDQCRKTLTTFTRLVPEWHPLHAVHIGPCNNCLAQSQRREMILEQVPDVLMLHFSEGLPHSNLKAYSFQFEGVSYEITMIIQYQSNHFVTWVLTADGSWLECDDLKGPYCWCHEKCEVPPSEIHIVYWERKNDIYASSRIHKENGEYLPLPCVLSVSPAQCNKVLSVPAERPKVNMSALSAEPLNVTWEQGGGLFGFQNLANDDAITLNLVEVKVDSGEKPQEHNHVIEVVEMARNCVPQPQENASVSPLQTSLQGKTSSKTVVTNGCAGAQSQSGLIEHCNALASLATSSVNDSTTVIVQERSKVLKQTFSKNSFIHEDPQFSQVNEGKPAVNIDPMPNNSDINWTCMNVVENDSLSLSKQNCKKGFASNWVNGLIGKHPVLPSSLSVKTPRAKNSKCNVPQQCFDAYGRNSKGTSPLEPNGKIPLKGATSFGGFIAKGINKSTEEKIVPRNECKQVSLPSSLKNISKYVKSVNSSENNLASPSVKTLGGFQSISNGEESPALKGSLKGAYISNGYQKLVPKNGDSDRENKIRRLRLKLLKKLKAKKNELASLDSLVNVRSNRNSENNTSRNLLDSESSKHASLQDLLKALQEHIDSVDSESVHTMSSNNSLCSSPGDAEFLAELLSPAPLPLLGMRKYEEDGTRLLEMLVDNVNGVSVPPHLKNGSVNGHHNYSTKETPPIVCSNSAINGSSFSFSNCESSMQEDVFEDLLCTFNSVGSDTDLYHFDEKFFESG